MCVLIVNIQRVLVKQILIIDLQLAVLHAAVYRQIKMDHAVYQDVSFSP